MRDLRAATPKHLKYREKSVKPVGAELLAKLAADHGEYPGRLADRRGRTSAGMEHS